MRFLGEDRAVEIVDCLLGEGTFTCHDDISKPDRDKQHCVGAMLILEKQNCPNQMMRISERLGDYNRNELVGHEEVFDDFDDWIESQCEFAE